MCSDAHGRTWLDPVIKPFEKLTYRVCGINPEHEHGWKRYTLAMLEFSLVGMLFTYVILRYQDRLPLNPQGMPGLAPHLAFNTAASFTTNTNWQSYGGESTMSYFSQMVGLAIHNFMSAATGIAIAAAAGPRHRAPLGPDRGKLLGRCRPGDLLRARADLPRLRALPGFAGHDPEFQAVHDGKDLRAIHRAGAEDGRRRKPRYRRADGKPVMVDQTVDTQTIAQGPMASQVAIKMLGTNGGGFVNANAAHPFENPTPLSNFLQILSIFAIPSALT